MLINPSMTLEGSLFSYPQVKYLGLVSLVPKKVPDSYLSKNLSFTGTFSLLEKR